MKMMNNSDGGGGANFGSRYGAGNESHIDEGRRMHRSISQLIRYISQGKIFTKRYNTQHTDAAKEDEKERECAREMWTYNIMCILSSARHIGMCVVHVLMHFVHVGVV